MRNKGDITMNNINYKAANVLIEQNNTSAVTINNFKTVEYGYLNSGYFNFKNSIITVDIDGKYFNLTSGYRRQFSNIYKLGFGNTESLRFNILDEIEEDTAFNDAYEIAGTLVKYYNINKEEASFSIFDNTRDFLIMLILHVKCSDYNEKTLYGCFNLLNNIDINDSDFNIPGFLKNIINSVHCSKEMHELISNYTKRFTIMNKNTIGSIYLMAFSILSVFQNSSLRNISSQSDFCIKDFVMNKPKSLYITLPSFDIDIYCSYIKLVILFSINKIKKFYHKNNFEKYSVLFLIDDFQNYISNPLNIYFNNTKNISTRNFDYKNKINIPLLSTREILLKECQESLKPDTDNRMWYDIPEEMYMQNEDVIFEPLFTSRIPDDDEISNESLFIQKISDKEVSKGINDENYINDNYYDERLKNLFKPIDTSSSSNKDIDYDRNKNNIEIILYKEIKQKEMYYTSKNESEINELYKIFSYDILKRLMDSSEQKGDRQGYICMLAGSAGTGKTETVLQLAKKCRRNLIKYDATQLSSGYIGVAQEKVKQIFDSYKKAVKASKNIPILFLNEADAIFSRRIDLSCNANQVSSLDENRTQTILLESLENFKGIIIATSNNMINFDPAFERRFLYKIVFDKPDKNARMKILKNKMPELKEEENDFIVNNYDLTGAQIENISRKLEIKKIINNGINFDDIKNLCKDETDNCFTVTKKPIGFK